jgi:hypothetical protein
MLPEVMHEAKCKKLWVENFKKLFKDSFPPNGTLIISVIKRTNTYQSCKTKLAR